MNYFYTEIYIIIYFSFERTYVVSLALKNSNIPKLADVFKLDAFTVRKELNEQRKYEKCLYGNDTIMTVMANLLISSVGKQIHVSTVPYNADGGI
jgi:hypothetical protein